MINISHQLYKSGKEAEKKTGVPMSGASVIGKVAGPKAEKQSVQEATKISGNPITSFKPPEMWYKKMFTQVKN